MKNMKIKVLFALFLGGCSLGFSQIKVSPVEIYNTVVDRGYEIQEVVERLGDYYYASKDYPKAFYWYEKLMKDGNYSPQPINRYRYAVVLQALGKKDEAKKQFNLFEVLTKKSDAPQTNPTPDCSREIIGTVTDAETGAKISGAQVYIFDSAMGALSSNTTDSKGSFTTKKLNCNFQNGFVEIVKKDYDIADVPIVFDEIEAALDEENTKKIVKLLNKFITKSQFILITHNKETMKGSHRLYGVTMNKEIGESRIISVDV